MAFLLSLTFTVPGLPSIFDLHFTWPSFYLWPSLYLVLLLSLTFTLPGLPSNIWPSLYLAFLLSLTFTLPGFRFIFDLHFTWPSFYLWPSLYLAFLLSLTITVPGLPFNLWPSLYLAFFLSVTFIFPKLYLIYSGLNHLNILVLSLPHPCPIRSNHRLSAIYFFSLWLLQVPDWHAAGDLRSKWNCLTYRTEALHSWDACKRHNTSTMMDSMM